MAEPLCRICRDTHNRITAACEVDHIKPVASGGSHDRDNLQPLCRACHAAKSERERVEARGGTYRAKRRYGADGWPVDD